MTTVLISSAGRRVELLRGFRAALCELGVDGRVVAVDRSPLASAWQAADEAWLVPSCTDPDFVPTMLDLCRRHAVDLVIPTIDTELPAYAAARDDFAAIGTTVAVSAPETVAIAADKVLTHQWLEEQGFPTVAQTTPDALDGWSYPLVVKPRAGSAGIGVAVVHDRAELDHAVGAVPAADVVVQALARGEEHTVDALVDRSGRCVGTVPRRRIEVRAGEVSKGVTVRFPGLQDLVRRLCEELPGAYGPLTVQAFWDAEREELVVIEVNARFGGGFPLAREAGADFPRWLLEEVLGLPPSAREDGWQDGLVMLRYDAAVFVRPDEDQP